jgi:hypothetical protein
MHILKLEPEDYTYIIVERKLQEVAIRVVQALDLLNLNLGNWGIYDSIGEHD